MRPAVALALALGTLGACDCETGTANLDGGPDTGVHPDAGAADAAECVRATDCPRRRRARLRSASTDAAAPFRICASTQGWRSTRGASDTGVQIPCTSAANDCPAAIVTPPGTCEAGAHWTCMGGESTSVCDSMRVCMPRMEAATASTASMRTAPARATAPRCAPAFRIRSAPCASSSRRARTIRAPTSPSRVSRVTHPAYGHRRLHFDAYLAAGTSELGSYVALDDGTFTGAMYGANGGECSGIALPPMRSGIAWSCPTCQYVMVFE